MSTSSMSTGSTIANSTLDWPRLLSRSDAGGARRARRTRMAEVAGGCARRRTLPRGLAALGDDIVASPGDAVLQWARRTMRGAPCTATCKGARARRTVVPGPFRASRPVRRRPGRASGLLGRLPGEPDDEARTGARRGRRQLEVAVHRPAQLARHVQPEAGALARGPRCAAFEPEEEAGTV